MLRAVTAIASLLTASLAVAGTFREQCPVDKDFACLVRQTPQGNAESYDRWWKMYRLGCRKAWGCASSQDVAAYLMIWSADGLDGELAEGITEDTENLLIWKPTCFFEGALALPREVREKLEDRYSPLFRPHLVMQALQQYRGYDRYRGLAERLAQRVVPDLQLGGAPEADERYPKGFVACK